MSRTAEILRSDLTYKVRNDIEKNNDRSNIEGTQVKTSKNKSQNKHVFLGQICFKLGVAHSNSEQGTHEVG